MPSTYKFWIITIVVLFVIGFLIAFAPVQRPIAAGLPESTFRYTFAEPLVTEVGQRAEKAKEIEELLKQAGVTTMYVKLPEDHVLELQTAAVTDEGAQRDQQLVTKTLQEKFKEVSGPEIPRKDIGKQRLVWQPFDFLAVYQPRPQVKLGLDLQGGAHVVLQCLPQTTMSFASPEEKPLYKVASAATEETAQTEGAGEEEEARKTEEPPAYQPPETEATLIEKVRSVLVRNGVPTEQVEVELVAANLLTVKTQANNEDAAERQEKLVHEFLVGNYPGVQIEKRLRTEVFVGRDTAERVKHIIDRRLYDMGDIREPVIQKQGDDQIIVELPGVKDPQRVLDILRSTALLEFVLVPPRYVDPIPEDNDYNEWTDQTTGEPVPWEVVYFASDRRFTGADLKSNATLGPGDAGDWVVNFELKDDRRIAFAEFTRKNVGEIMAIVLDTQCQMAPVIRTEISGGRGQIEGNMDADEARDLKLLLNAGALPVPLEIVENRTVSATLGQDTISRSLQAALVAFACVLVFMALYYRLPGLLAGIALIMYVILILAVLVVVGATMTLPGIAGLILSIGLAVDANIIIFERLREELASSKTMRSAVETGFDRAWTAILDGNVTTLIVAAVLYFLGTSLIKSFAVVLFLGVCTSLFTAVTVTRWLVTMVSQSRWGQNRGLYGVGSPPTSPG